MKREELSTLIKRELADREMSVTQLAKEAGLPFESVRGLYHGIRSPSIEYISAILKVFGLALHIGPAKVEQTEEQQDGAA